MLQAVLSIFVLATYWTSAHSKFDVFPNPSGKHLKVYVFPVGQGDCTIIECPTGQLIINDCGSSGGIGLNSSEVSEVLGRRVNDIVAIIISHGDRNHYNYISPRDHQLAKQEHKKCDSRRDNE